MDHDNPTYDANLQQVVIQVSHPTAWLDGFLSGEVLLCFFCFGVAWLVGFSPSQSCSKFPKIHAFKTCLCSKLTAFLWNELAFGKMASLFFFRVFFSTFHILYDVIETLMLLIPQKFATLPMNHKTSAIHY